MGAWGISYNTMTDGVFANAINEGRKFGLHECTNADKQKLVSTFLTAATVLVCSVRSRKNEYLDENQRCFHWLLACQAAMTLAVVCGKMDVMGRETRWDPCSDIEMALQEYLSDSNQVARCDLTKAGMKTVGLPDVGGLYRGFVAGDVPDVVLSMIKADADEYRIPANGGEVVRMLKMAVRGERAEARGYGVIARHKVFQYIPESTWPAFEFVAGHMVLPACRFYRRVRAGRAGEGWRLAQ